MQLFSCIGDLLVVGRGGHCAASDKSKGKEEEEKETKGEEVEEPIPDAVQHTAYRAPELRLPPSPKVGVMKHKKKKKRSSHDVGWAGEDGHAHAG